MSPPFDYTDSDGTVIALAGEFVDYESVPRARTAGNDSRIPADLEVIDRSLVRIGNRDYTGFDYRWVLDAAVHKLTYPEQIMAVERYEWGNFYGYLKAVKENGEIVDTDPDWGLVPAICCRESAQILEEIHHIEKNLIGVINYEMETPAPAGKGTGIERRTGGQPGFRGNPDPARLPAGGIQRLYRAPLQPV